jgi:hypothetical protein
MLHCLLRISCDTWSRNCGAAGNPVIDLRSTDVAANCYALIGADRRWRFMGRPNIGRNRPNTADNDDHTSAEPCQHPLIARLAKECPKRTHKRPLRQKRRQVRSEEYAKHPLPESEVSHTELLTPIPPHSLQPLRWRRAGHFGGTLSGSQKAENPRRSRRYQLLISRHRAEVRRAK